MLYKQTGQWTIPECLHSLPTDCPTVNILTCSIDEDENISCYPSNCIPRLAMSEPRLDVTIDLHSGTIVSSWVKFNHMYSIYYSVHVSVVLAKKKRCYICNIFAALLWRHNGHDDVSNHQFHDCLLNRIFTHRSKKTSKLRVTGLCVGNSPGAGEFPVQMASNAENVSIWWRHHGLFTTTLMDPGNIENVFRI